MLSENEIDVLNERLIKAFKDSDSISELQLRRLSDTEIQAKKNEFNSLYERNELLYNYLLNGRLDNTINDNDALLISRILRLKEEIDTGIGRVSREEQDLVIKFINNQLAGRRLKTEILDSV